MITEQAKKFAKVLESTVQTRDIPAGKKYSHLLVEELIENCEPTIDEFDALTGGLMLDGRLIWKLVVAIPRWSKSGSGPYDVKEV